MLLLVVGAASRINIIQVVRAAILMHFQSTVIILLLRLLLTLLTAILTLKTLILKLTLLILLYLQHQYWLIVLAAAAVATVRNLLTKVARATAPKRSLTALPRLARLARSLLRDAGRARGLRHAVARIVRQGPPAPPEHIGAHSRVVPTHGLVDRRAGIPITEAGPTGLLGATLQLVPAQLSLPHFANMTISDNGAG